MATDNYGRSQLATIAGAITAELARQRDLGSVGVDVDALARAVDEALGQPTPSIEGKHPDELNATNDD